MKKTLYSIILIIFLMILTIVVEHFSNIDVIISNHFYDFTKHEWYISAEEHEKLRLVFYDGPKAFVATIGTICVMYMLSSIWIKKWRWNFIAVMTVLLSTIFVPTVVANLKRVTNTYCPNQTKVYEGIYPYIKILASYPQNFSPEHEGRCFPAGHVTGFFSLMSLYLVFRNRKRKYAALGSAIVLGFVTSSYQMLRGEHFISHNLFSMLIAAIMIILINLVLKKIFNMTQFAKSKEKLHRKNR